MTFALILPSSSGAARVGLKLPVETETSRYCDDGPTYCNFTVLQTRVAAGTPMKAPFTGTIKRFTVQDGGGQLRLVVVRRQKDGDFKALRESRYLGAPAEGWEHVNSWDMSVPIRKGDYIGFRHEGYYFDMATLAQTGARYWWFRPELELGVERNQFGPYADEISDEVYLYNATLVR